MQLLCRFSKIQPIQVVRYELFRSAAHTDRQFVGMGLFHNDEPQVVLVPPLFERDHRGRSRMAKSSYDTQFGRLQLKWLFNDYTWPSATSLLRFSPAEDRRITVKARVGTSLDGALGSDSSGDQRVCCQLLSASQGGNGILTPPDA